MGLRIALSLIGCLTLVSCATWEPDTPVVYRPAPQSLYRPLRYAPAQRSVLPQIRHRSPPSSADAWPPAFGPVSARWSTIVIHHSATDRGSAGTFDRFHRRKGWDELGYHFVIGNGTETRDGLIEVGPRWNKQKQGAHCKTPDQHFNKHGIGICLVGDFTKRRPTDRQMASLSRLVNYLRYACNIPSGRVTTHGIVNPKTLCPGPKFSLGALRARMGGPASVSSMR